MKTLLFSLLLIVSLGVQQANATVTCITYQNTGQTFCWGSNE